VNPLARYAGDPETQRLVLLSIGASVVSALALSELYRRIHPGHTNVLRKPLAAAVVATVGAVGWASYAAWDAERERLSRITQG